MTVPPQAWPQTDEDALQQQSEALQTVRTELGNVRQTWNSGKAAIFNPSGWFGSASSAAESNVDKHIQALDALDRQLGHAIDFYNQARDATVDAKKEIIARTERAQKKIDGLENEMGIGSTIDNTGKIEELVADTLAENSRTVTTAAGVLGSKFPAPDKPKSNLWSAPFGSASCCQVRRDIATRIPQASTRNIA